MLAALPEIAGRPLGILAAIAVVYAGYLCLYYWLRGSYRALRKSEKRPEPKRERKSAKEAENAAENTPDDGR